MIYEIAADLTALMHLSFIAFVIFGVILGYQSRTWRALHLGAMTYGVLIEIFDWYCPLTHLEQYLRIKSGRGSYQDAFIAHYLNQIIYVNVPQWALILGAGVVLSLNVTLYVYWWRNHRESQPERSGLTVGGSR